MMESRFLKGFLYTALLSTILCSCYLILAMLFIGMVFSTRPGMNTQGPIASAEKTLPIWVGDAEERDLL